MHLSLPPRNREPLVPNRSPLPNLLLYTSSSLPSLNPALIAEPRPLWLLGHAHAVPMEPFIRTVIVVASHHVPITNALARAVLPVVSFPLGVLVPFLHIHIHPIAIRLRQHALAVTRFTRRGLSGAKIAPLSGAASRLRVGGRFLACRGVGVEMADALVRWAVADASRRFLGWRAGACATAAGGGLLERFRGAGAKGGLA